LINEGFHSYLEHKHKCIRVINFNCGAKSKYKHKDCPHLIKVSSSITKIVKILVFLVQFMFMHDPSIIMFVASIPNMEAHEQLELIHKTLITGISF
jgi:hypothetical protein